MSLDALSDAGSENHLYNKQISVTRTSVLNDQLTKDDYHEGILEKQSPSFHKRWQKRYFVLKNRHLFYYKTKADYDKQLTCRGVLNF